LKIYFFYINTAAIHLMQRWIKSWPTVITHACVIPNQGFHSSLKDKWRNETFNETWEISVDQCMRVKA